MDVFFNDVIVSGKEWSGGKQGKGVLKGSHIFVCAHGSRDVRCGVCGPVLMDKFNEEIQLRGLKDQISVLACSHIGGHKYAGNVIIFSPGSDGKIMGHWLVLTSLLYYYVIITYLHPFHYFCFLFLNLLGPN